MEQLLRVFKIFASLSLTMAIKDPFELPPCPQSLQFLPQELPMHCRLPRSTDNQGGPFSFLDNTAKQPLPFALPPYPPMPGIPPNLPMNMPFRRSETETEKPMPMPLPMPMSMSMPMSMPMSVQGGQPHKMPVIVMPFYSQDRKSFKKPSRHSKNYHKKSHHKKHRHDDSSQFFGNDDDSDTVSDSDSRDRDHGWWKQSKKNKYKDYGIYRRFNKNRDVKRKNKKTELLTPILQYVTKDGYVIFEKKITKNEANNWLEPKDRDKANEEFNFKKGLEAELKNDAAAEESEVEEFSTLEISKVKENKLKSIEEKEANEMEKNIRPNVLKKQKPRRFGSVLGHGP